MKDEISLKNLTLDETKLKDLGFIKEKEYYKYEVIVMDQFLMTIKIDNNMVISDCYDIQTNEKLIPYYITNSSGEFISKIKQEYEHIIQNIKDKCSSKDIFKNAYSKLVIKYIKDKYGDELEYLWEKFSNNAIWRNKINNKWYALLLTVEKSKIGINEEGTMEIIDLRLEPEEIKRLVDNKNYLGGYHMNKKYWITIKLDGSVSIDEIYKLIDNSYEISINKK